MASSSRIDRSSSTTRMRGGTRSAGGAARWAAVLMGSSRRDGRSSRQAYRHTGAGALLRAHLNLTVVVRNDAVDDGEAEAAALGEAAVKRLEQTVQFLDWNADAGVLYRQHYAL